MEDNKRKKAPNLVLTIVCVVLILVFLVGCIVCIVNFKQGGYQSGAGVPNQIKDTNKNVEVAEDKPEEIEDEEIDLDVDPSIADYVSVADYKPLENLPEEYNVDEQTYRLSSIEVPYVTISSDYAKTINSELKKVYDEAIEVYKNGATNGRAYVDKFSYVYHLNGDILSILLETAYGETDVPYSTFHVYNINVKDGSKVEEKDIAKYLNVSEDKLKDEIWENIEKYIDENKEEFGGQEEEMKTQTKAFFDNGEYQVLLGENDALVGIAKFAIPAGRGYFFDAVAKE